MTTSQTFIAAAKSTYVNFTTFRKNGSAATTPVWIAGDDGRAYLWTNADSWKVKRLDRDPRCEMTPCTMNGKKNLGDTVGGTARRIDAGELPKVKTIFRKKYGVQYWLFEFLGRVRPGNRHAYFEIEERAIQGG